MSHKSELLEKHIGQLVRITFRHYVGAYRGERTTYTGILHHTKVGFRPYVLATKDFDFVFSKSEVRKIELIS